MQMSKRPVQILSVALQIAAAAWALGSASKATSDEARYEQWQRPIDTWVRLYEFESHLPTSLSKTLYLPTLEQRCLDKNEKIEEALIASGYLTSARVAVPNAGLYRTQIGDRLRKATRGTDAKWVFWVQSNAVVVVTCRPRDVAACVRAIEND